MPGEGYQGKRDDDERDELGRAFVVLEEHQLDGSADQTENEKPAEEAFFGHDGRPRLSSKSRKTTVSVESSKELDRL